MKTAITTMIMLQLLTVTLGDVEVFDVRDPPSPYSNSPHSNIRQQPVFDHTSAHTGAMPLGRLLASEEPEDQGFPRLTQFDEEPQLHEKVMLAEMKASPQQRKEQVRDRTPIRQQRDQLRDGVKGKKPETSPKPQQPARIRAQSAPLVSNRYLGIGRRDPNEEVFPSDFLRERSAKLRRQEEYERIQLQNPSGRWYFFVPSSPVTVAN